MKLQPAEVQRLLTTYLHFNPQTDLQHIFKASSVEIGQKLLNDLKINIKKLYKQAALELHPDRTGGDLVKADIFAKLSILMTEIEDWKVIKQPPRPVVNVFVTHLTTTNNTTTSYTRWTTAF